MNGDLKVIYLIKGKNIRGISSAHCVKVLSVSIPNCVATVNETSSLLLFPILFHVFDFWEFV